MKGRVVIGLFADLGLIDPIFYLYSIQGKTKIHYRAVCTAQKMPVRLFNSIFFLVILFFCFRLIMQDRGIIYYVISSG